jgi:dihydrodipicolinate reductase
MRLRICVAGATGCVGKPLCRALSEADDLSLVGAVSRRHKGQSLKAAIGDLNLDVTVSGSVREAFVISVEAIFGAKDERLTIRHDAGSGAEPYIQGTLLAVHKVKDSVGLVRGLDKIMD